MQVLALPPPSGGHSHNGTCKNLESDGGLRSTGRGLRAGDTSTAEGFDCSKLIKMEHVGWCLRYRLRVGDTPTTGRTKHLKL